MTDPAYRIFRRPTVAAALLLALLAAPPVHAETDEDETREKAKPNPIIQLYLKQNMEGIGEVAADIIQHAQTAEREVWNRLRESYNPHARRHRVHGDHAQLEARINARFDEVMARLDQLERQLSEHLDEMPDVDPPQEGTDHEAHKRSVRLRLTLKRHVDTPEMPSIDLPEVEQEVEIRK